MEFNQILELIDHVSASELTAFTYETADLTLSMEHGKPQVIQGVMGETVENIPAAEVSIETEEDEEFITSPIVGTFYSAAAPDIPAFVRVGDHVKSGQTVCILEAMKLMNEIQAEYDCEIEAVLVSNEQKVEYGQPLFRVKKL